MKPRIFEQNRRVQADDLDTMQHVNNVRYLQWIQDIAEAHWLSQATDEMQHKHVWVVLSHFIEYKNPLYINEKVLLRTYVGEVSGPKYDRIVEIWNSSEEKLCVRAKSVWCLLDGETLRPKRVTDDIRQIFENFEA